jgi:hypothetical protein
MRQWWRGWTGAGGRTMAAVAAAGVAGTAPVFAGPAVCGFNLGGRSAGSVTVEEFVARVSREGPESSRRAPIDRRAPGRVELASFGLG